MRLVREHILVRDYILVKRTHLHYHEGRESLVGMSRKPVAPKPLKGRLDVSGLEEVTLLFASVRPGVSRS